MSRKKIYVTYILIVQSRIVHGSWVYGNSILIRNIIMSNYKATVMVLVVL